jgi:EAL domain-containing protein (putative c-di-GMP-specific phosphodiesterase class I)
MNTTTSPALPAELLELFSNRAANDGLFMDWVHDNAIAHVRTDLGGTVKACYGLNPDSANADTVGQHVAMLYTPNEANSSTQDIVERVKAHCLAGRLGVVAVKMQRSCTEVWAEHEGAADVLVLPVRDNHQPTLLWIEIKAITTYKNDAQAKAFNQVFGMCNLDLVLVLKKAYNFSARSGLFVLNKPVFNDAKFSQNGTFSHAIRLTEGWADYLEFTHDDGETDVYKNAVRQLFNEQGKPVGYVSVSQLANGKHGPNKRLTSLGPMGFNRRIIDADELRLSIEDSITESAAMKTGFSLIFLEITFDPMQKNPDEQARALFVNKFLNRLQKVIRRNDVISCTALNRFAILLKYVNSPNALDRIVNYFKKEFAENHAPSESFGNMKLNGGSVSFPHDGRDYADIMEKVQVALDLSKLHFGSEIYQWKNVSEHVRDDQLSRDLMNALVHNQLYLTYQPQIDFYGPNLVKEVEIAPEWNHPIFGKVPPAEIYQLAQSNGAIVSLGEWMFRQVFKNMATLKTLFGDELTLSVGVISPQMLDKALVAKLTAGARAADIHPHQIYLEIPEAMVVEEKDQTRASLMDLKASGFKLSIDNFGINNFNWLQLSKTPIDVLKLDKSFVEGVTHDEKNLSIIRCIINMAHALGLEVVSGGAESVEQVNALYRNGCYVFQGALTGQRMTMPDLLVWQTHLSDITDLRDKMYSQPASL